MSEFLAPGVYVEEIDMGVRPIEGVSTSTAGFLGPTERGPVAPQFLTSFPQYTQVFGGFLTGSGPTGSIVRITECDQGTADSPWLAPLLSELPDFEYEPLASSGEQDDARRHVLYLTLTQHDLATQPVHQAGDARAE